MVTLEIRASTYEFVDYNSVCNTSQCRKGQLFFMKNKNLVSWISSTQWNALTRVLWLVHFVEPCATLAITGAHTASLTNYVGSRAGKVSVVFFLVLPSVPQFLYQLAYSRQHISQEQIYFFPESKYEPKLMGGKPFLTLERHLLCSWYEWGSAICRRSFSSTWACQNHKDFHQPLTWIIFSVNIIHSSSSHFLPYI